MTWEGGAIIFEMQRTANLFYASIHVQEAGTDMRLSSVGLKEWCRERFSCRFPKTHLLPGEGRGAGNDGDAPAWLLIVPQQGGEPAESLGWRPAPGDGCEKKRVAEGGREGGRGREKE